RRYRGGEGELPAPLEGERGRGELLHPLPLGQRSLGEPLYPLPSGERARVRGSCGIQSPCAGSRTSASRRWRTFRPTISAWTRPSPTSVARAAEGAARLAPRAASPTSGS